VTIFALTAGGVLVAVMIGIAVFGWRTLPADARVPIHYGVGSWDNFASKTFALVLWPVIGLLIYGLFGAIMDSAIKPDHPGSHAALFILPAVLLLLAVSEWAAVRAARRTARS
jgi:hypothetical protein